MTEFLNEADRFGLMRLTVSFKYLSIPTRTADRTKAFKLIEFRFI